MDVRHREGKAPTVFVVDDDKAVLSALSRLLKSVDQPTVCFDSAAGFLDHYDGSVPGCLVLDLKMPDINGLQLQDELARRDIPIPVVFISGNAEIPESVRAMKAGAVDFISKPFDECQLVEAISRAMEADLKCRRDRALQSEVLGRAERLTPRERQVMFEVVKGQTNRVIAERLGTSEKTIKVHRARVMQKMRADSLADLVRLTETPALKNSETSAK